MLLDKSVDKVLKVFNTALADLDTIVVAKSKKIETFKQELSDETKEQARAIKVQAKLAALLEG